MISTLPSPISGALFFCCTGDYGAVTPKRTAQSWGEGKTAKQPPGHSQNGMRPGGVFCLRSNYRCGAGRRGSAEEGERPGYDRSTTARKICLHTRHRNAGTRGELHAQLAAVFHCQRPAAFIDAIGKHIRRQ